MFTDRENISFSTIKTYFYPLHFQNQLFTILGDQECKHPTSLVDRCMDDTQIGFKFAQCRPSEPVDSRGKEKCRAIILLTFIGVSLFFLLVN